MQFRGSAKVVTATGDVVGGIDRVVLDPRTKEVTNIVVRKGLLFTTDKVVPISAVAQTTDEQVTLKPDVTDLDLLPDFEETHYVNVGANEWGRRRSGAAEREMRGRAQVPAMYWYPPASLGPGLTAGTVPYFDLPSVVSETHQNIPDNTVALKEGAKVVSADGETIGDVERVFADSASKRATHLLISRGLLFRTHKPIPVTWIETVTEDEVNLAVSAKLLKALPEYDQ